MSPAKTAAMVSCLCLPACTPSLEIGGAYFPAWLVCILNGLVATLALRGLLVFAGIDRYVRPRRLAYPSMMVTLTLIVWLALYSR